MQGFATIGIFSSKPKEKNWTKQVFYDEPSKEKKIFQSLLFMEREISSNMITSKLANQQTGENIKKRKYSFSLIQA